MMGLIRLFLTVILGMMFASGPAAAQEDYIAEATSSLDRVLSTLKQSVEKLSLDNDQLAARDNAMKQQILQLQARLGQLQGQGNLLNKSVALLQDKNPRRARQITRLEKENFDLDNRTQKAEVSIKSIQESLQAGYEEDQKLLLQLKGMTNALPASPPSASPADLARQKGKLKLMKMIYDSQQRQESLRNAILELQKNSPLMPEAGALARQQVLKGQIKDLEAQIAASPSQSLAVNGGFSNQTDQLHQLASELKILEKNYSQLKELMEQMSKKAQAGRMTVDQHIEEKKLQGKIDDLNRQGEGLRADLDDLRSQMVDLDKRKSRLEVMIKQLP